MRRQRPERRGVARAALLAFVVLIAVPLAANELPPLKSLMPPGLRIGAALNQAQIDGADAASLAIVTRHFNSITAEDILKWENIHPEPDRYEFGDAPVDVAELPAWRKERDRRAIC